MGMPPVSFSCESAGIAQLVERPAEKRGAVLTRVRVPGAARDFSPKVKIQRRLSFGVRTAPVRNRLHQHLCMFIIPNTASHTIVWTHKNTTHTDRNG